jgi:ABC-type Na+ transport system ATPase subunit NatA
MENKKPERKLSNLYILSTVAVPRDEAHLYKAMTVEENTKFIDFIYDKLKADESILTKRPLILNNLNFKAKISHKHKYKEIQVILKKYNISFSSLYRKLYQEFAESKGT